MARRASRCILACSLAGADSDRETERSSWLKHKRAADCGKDHKVKIHNQDDGS